MIVTLANALADEGFSVEILCTYFLGEPAYPLNEKVIVSYLTHDAPNRKQFAQAVHGKNPFFMLREGLRAVGILWRKKRTMKQALKRIQEGAVISTRHEHSILLSRYGGENVKKIAQLHSDHNFNPKLIRDFRKKYQHIDYFVLLTEQTTQEIKQLLQGYNSTTQCITIPNFIDPPSVAISYPKKKQVIAAGRLHPDKDFSTLLRIWARVWKDHSDWRLKIAGEGDLEYALKQEASALQIGNSICFAGALEHGELMKEMAVSTCYALTSVSESFGLVLVEAMACATPPVAFDIRVGPRSIIQNGVNGFLIPERNEDLFAEKISCLMDNRDLCEQMGNQAQHRAEEFYKDKVLRQWTELLS